MQVIAASDEDSIEDAMWNFFISGRLEDYLQIEQKAMTFKRRECSSANCYTTLCEGMGLEHRMIWRELVWRGKNIGNMIFLEYHREFSEEDMLFVDSVADAVAYNLAFQMNLKSVQEPNAEIVLMDLLKGIRVPEEPICRYLLQKKNPGNIVIGTAELKQENDSPRLLDGLKETLMTKIPGTVAVHYEGRLVFVLKNNHQIDWPEFEQYIEKSGCVCGVSNPFVSYDETKLFYQQALQTLEYGKRYFGKNRVFYFFDIAPLYLLGQTDISANVKQFLHPAMALVMQYDESHGTNWLSSLYTFIYFNGDMRKTAEVLNVSKSSMHYRINKVQEIIGHGLTSSYFVFHMRWSFNILYFMEGDTFYKKYDLP